MIVIDSVVGLKFADMYAKFGAEVTILDLAEYFNILKTL
jgi:pyruvate/2-oxoglutarate dehydrogenase complex dihydrolipoamide dehydrogenase (E3) component